MKNVHRSSGLTRWWSMSASWWLLKKSDCETSVQLWFLQKHFGFSNGSNSQNSSWVIVWLSVYRSLSFSLLLHTNTQPECSGDKIISNSQTQSFHSLSRQRLANALVLKALKNKVTFRLHAARSDFVPQIPCGPDENYKLRNYAIQCCSQWLTNKDWSGKISKRHFTAQPKSIKEGSSFRDLNWCNINITFHYSHHLQ